MNRQNYLTVKELADILGVTRITVFRRIKNGDIPAIKIGRNFIIDKKEIFGTEPTDKVKDQIDRGVKKVIKEYTETLKMLGKE